MDSLDHLRPGSGIAWKSIIQVRLLHAGVRCRLSKVARAHSKVYNIEEYGVPINQEDMLATLFSLSAVAWQMMERKLGVSMTTQEREDYLHVWRYVGYMIGVDDILGATHSSARAGACIESILLHLADPDEDSGIVCQSLLQSVSPKIPVLNDFLTLVGLPDLFKIHMVMSENLFGPETWSQLGLAPATPLYQLYRKLILH
ncbi:hypothetical protein BGX26_008116, partial [Mortierella sp. AD094]